MPGKITNADFNNSSAEFKIAWLARYSIKIGKVKLISKYQIVQISNYVN